MIFVYLTLCVCLLDWLVAYLLVKQAEHRFKTKYPDLILHKNHRSDTAISFLKIALLFICPILNLYMMAVMLNYSDAICENVVQKIYEKSREASDDQSAS